MWLPVVASKKAILAWWACDEMKVVTSKEWFCGSGSGLLLHCKTHFLDLYLFPCSFLLGAAHLLLLGADALLVRKVTIPCSATLLLLGAGSGNASELCSFV
ncbi:uncharacterized protein DS421_15g503430 [Arachis hypogaea]|nr:uncharacterized protein DS421_15g503430 [Arachis hypogaea]